MDYAPVREIEWDLPLGWEDSKCRRHFVQVLRSIQYGCLTLFKDVAMFREIFNTQSGTPSKLTDRRSELFLEALFYHVAVFRRALNDIEVFRSNGKIKPGPSQGFDLDETLASTRGCLKQLSLAVTALQLSIGSPENPFKDGKFLGVLTPTAAPRELLLSMVWTRKFREHNSSALEKGQTLTEEELKATLEQFAKYPNFEELDLSADFGADLTRGLKEDKQLSNGIPRMFFICVGSPTASATGGQLQHVKIGATTPVWSTFPEFQKMCRLARVSRFGPDKIPVLKKAVDALTAFEAEHYGPVRERLEKEAAPRAVNKKKLTDAKIKARKHAIDSMQGGHPDFIDHLQEIGQAYNGKALGMNFACYCCQGIFGYRNVLKEATENDTRDNITRWERSKLGQDYVCAEAAASLQCKAVTTPVPYQDSLPYA